MNAQRPVFSEGPMMQSWLARSAQTEHRTRTQLSRHKRRVRQWRSSNRNIESRFHHADHAFVRIPEGAGQCLGNLLPLHQIRRAPERARVNQRLLRQQHFVDFGESRRCW